MTATVTMKTRNAITAVISGNNMEFFNKSDQYAFMCQNNSCINVDFRVLPEGYIMCTCCGQHYQYNATTQSWLMVTDDHEPIEEEV